MRLCRKLMRGACAACAGVVAVHAAPAQKSADPSSSATSPELRAAIMTWRSGLEVSVNGSGWNRSVSVALSKAQCPPSETSPCASGSAVGVDVRFPTIAQAVDLSRTRATIGEPAEAEPGTRYEVRLVRAESSPLCPSGFVAATPRSTARLAINLSSAGPPLPLACRWTAVVGIPDPSDPSKVAAVWSDTASVFLTSKR